MHMNYASSSKDKPNTDVKIVLYAVVNKVQVIYQTKCIIVYVLVINASIYNISSCLEIHYRLNISNNNVCITMHLPYYCIKSKSKLDVLISNMITNSMQH